MTFDGTLEGYFWNKSIGLYLAFSILPVIEREVHQNPGVYENAIGQRLVSEAIELLQDRCVSVGLRVHCKNYWPFLVA